MHKTKVISSILCPILRRFHPRLQDEPLARPKRKHRICCASSTWIGRSASPSRLPLRLSQPRQQLLHRGLHPKFTIRTVYLLQRGVLRGLRKRQHRLLQQTLTRAGQSWIPWEDWGPTQGGNAKKSGIWRLIKGEILQRCRQPLVYEGLRGVLLLVGGERGWGGNAVRREWFLLAQFSNDWHVALVLAF